MVAGPRERSQVIPDRAEAKRQIGNGPGGRVVVRMGDSSSGGRPDGEREATPRAQETPGRPRRIKAVARRRPPRADREIRQPADASDAGGRIPPTVGPPGGMTFPKEPGGEPERRRAAAERLAKKVLRRNIFAKLPDGANIKEGKHVIPLYAGLLIDHGPDRPHPEAKDLTLGVDLLQIAVSQHQNELPDLMNVPVVSVLPYEEDRGTQKVRFSFFQDRRQIDGRGWCQRAHVSVDLHDGEVSEFMEGIRRDPDLLEEFYQSTFPGLDSDGASPGMRRIPANGFFILPGDKLTYAIVFRKSSLEELRTFFNGLERHTYTDGPYGTGNEFEPNF